jgi:two-component system chemotaxis sensor kinase CheA
MHIPKETMEHIKDDLDHIARLVSGLSHDDIPALGRCLNSLESLETHLAEQGWDDVKTVTTPTRDYLGTVVLGDNQGLEPLRDAIYLIRAMIRHRLREEPFGFDYTDVLEKLVHPEPPAAPATAAVIPPARGANGPAATVRRLDEDDEAILGDFVIESRENLESIEVNLIDLEEHPDDKEIINAIFRPFHTIKGISGFLDLQKINLLSHCTENLLDSARKGRFVIDHEVTDVILQAVDLLKRLIGRVAKGLESGTTADDADIDIKALSATIERMDVELSRQETPRRMGEILVDSGALTAQALDEALNYQAEHPERKLGEILVEESGVESRQVISALREQKRVRKPGPLQVKVDIGKLDNLVDLTGELVIAQSMLRQGAASGQKTNQNLNQLGQIVSHIQKIAMSMRMVPISATFQKMVRLVRDLAKSCKKDVLLTMSGEETEIDRNVVEALYEPMVHMIRNAIDHGLEPSEDRKRAGKSEKGTIRLSAYHKGGNIVIEIEDDGRGLDTMTILEKAVKQGLVASDAVLSDKEIFMLVMKPGFSTAQAITDISGRGVGMDVVKKAIEAMSGRVDIESVQGKGTTVIITLPLTLAIIDGMLVRIGADRFIIPTMAILESFRPRREDYFTVEDRGEMLMFRKHLIPLIRLNEICGVAMEHEDVWNNIAIVVESNKQQRALLIDELLGKEEYVIKSLGETLKNIKGLAGGAIMGDGTVGLILDIGGLFDVALRS